MKALPFTKPKFLKLEEKQQHKKCAELLRIIYEDFLLERKNSQNVAQYNDLLYWMSLGSSELSSEKNLKVLSDRYHWHLKEAKINLKEHNLLPFIRKEDREPKLDFPNCVVYLDHIRSAYNVGSILRTTEALRIGSIHFSSKTPFIDNEKVQKTSQGSYKIVPCFQNSELKNLPRPIIALETSSDGMSLFSFLFPETFTLVLGNEEYGISDETLQEVDYVIEIPLFGAKNSINVACAFSIAAGEIRKQR